MKDHLKICSAVIILLAVMPSVLASAIGCQLACKKCRQRNEHPSIVTVYCEMCQECKIKRDIRLRTGTTMEPYQDVVEVEDIADCPKPPDCPEEEPSTSTTTNKPSTKKPCPPAPICVLKRHPPPPPPMPCMGCPCPMMMPPPMCMQPGPNQFPQSVSTASTAPVTTTRKKDEGEADYLSVFVGIPKDLQLDGLEDGV